RRRASRSSGSVRSASSVDPTRSQKRAVTTLRSAIAARCVVRGDPQPLQNRASAAFDLPHAAHAATGRLYRSDVVRGTLHLDARTCRWMSPSGLRVHVMDVIDWLL